MSETAFRRKVEWSALVHGLESGKELELETQLFQRACVLCVRSLGASCPPQLKSFFLPPGASGRCPVSSRPLLPPQGGVPSLPGPCPVPLREVSRPPQGGEHEFEQAPGVGEEQGCLACCSPWGHKESDRTEQLSNNQNA